MCEFRVFIRRGGQEEVVAEDIVYAEVGDGSIVLKNVLGNPVRVDSASISEVDVEAERMVLVPTSSG